MLGNNELPKPVLRSILAPIDIQYQATKQLQPKPNPQKFVNYAIAIFTNFRNKTPRPNSGGEE